MSNVACEKCGTSFNLKIATECPTCKALSHAESQTSLLKEQVEIQSQILSEQQKSNAWRNETYAPSLPCPSCQVLIREDSNNCRHCGCGVMLAYTIPVNPVTAGFKTALTVLLTLLITVAVSKMVGFDLAWYVNWLILGSVGYVAYQNFRVLKIKNLVRV